jgi:hypothetical protein
LPPPADETRRPDTLKGTLLVELQLPAVVAKATLQTPSKAPALARRAASAVPGTATAATTATASIHRKARMGLKSAKKAMGRAEIIIFFLLFHCAAEDASGYVKQPGSTVHRCQSGWALS